MNHFGSVRLDQGVYEQSVLLESGICLRSSEEKLIRYSCPLVAVYYQTEYVKQDKSEWPDYEMPIKIKDFVVDVICKFKASILKNSLSRKQTTALNEIAYHQEFYRVTASLYKGSINANVGSWYGVLGALDLYLNQATQFGFEFLISGRQIDEHIGRFTGRNATIPLKQHAVIDFYEHAGTEAEAHQRLGNLQRRLINHENYYLVIFFDGFSGFFIRNRRNTEKHSTLNE